MFFFLDTFFDPFFVLFDKGVIDNVFCGNKEDFGGGGGGGGGGKVDLFTSMFFEMVLMFCFLTTLIPSFSTVMALFTTPITWSSFVSGTYITYINAIFLPSYFRSTRPILWTIWFMLDVVAKMISILT